MKYYIITGEASGDLHASNLMKELKNEDAQADFRFWGGDLMQAQGGEMVKHYRETAFMGFITVLKNLKTIRTNFTLCESDLLAYAPDVLILVDYPGFNLRMAAFAKKHGIRVHYYISPKIWAWKESRIKKIKAHVDRMFTIFPFETEFYKKHNYEVSFGGNPLLDAIENRENRSESFDHFIERNQLAKKPIIALLAGSRKQEIERILPVMLQVADRFPDYQFVVAAAPAITKEFYASVSKGSQLRFVYSQTYDLLQQSKAALVASGTATLETALLRIPQVVCYKMSGGSLAYRLGKILLNIKYISLVNLVVDKFVVKELIQQYCNPKRISAELDLILNDKAYRSQMLANYEELNQHLGGAGASARFAKMIYEDVKAIKA
ncbi:lipid-A-disaccharide synthase [Ancylomarina sp. 16SWW S1-10-2]|uniref:lipid-A-disaccharide synthase n=1 Tax=Ancylomarina sp. 16SWW S1-10-2 TaxID=2499681 RepID=UPI0012AE36BF|nr:lipid-A-disaccharide synthase [Ancylomarina sp. 16SWW S1-10-2]MRT93744.1 lipid-A-disaccharide synthase [Ancylomarina sp. 16SWW S1-10-2]